MTVEWFYVYRLHITNIEIFLIEQRWMLGWCAHLFKKYTLTPKNIYFFKTSHLIQTNLYIQWLYYHFTYKAKAICIVPTPQLVCLIQIALIHQRDAILFMNAGNYLRKDNRLAKRIL